MSYLCVFMLSCYINDGPMGSALIKMAAMLSFVTEFSLLKCKKKHRHYCKKINLVSTCSLVVFYPFGMFRYGHNS